MCVGEGEVFVVCFFFFFWYMHQLAFRACKTYHDNGLSERGAYLSPQFWKFQFMFRWPCFSGLHHEQAAPCMVARKQGKQKETRAPPLPMT